MKNSNYIINLLLKENGLPGKIKKLQSNFDALNGSVESINQTINTVAAGVSSGLGQVDGAVNKTANNIKKGLSNADFVAFTNVIRNTSEGFNTLTSSGSSFEQSMANLSASTGITGKDLDELNRIARESGKATGIGAAEAANAFTQLASQVKVSKVGLEGLKTLQQETVTLSKAGGIGMTEAATAMTDTINQFGLGAEDANRVINLLAAGSQNGTAGITDLAASLKVTGAAAVASGVSVEQAAGALEVLSQNNLKGAEAGTALSDILTTMQSSLGMDLSQTGLSTALESLTPLLGNTSALTRIFGETNAGAVEYLIQNATSVAGMTTALTDTSVAQEQAAIHASTYAERVAQMQAVVDDAKISLFEASGGMSAYATVMADNAVAVAQLVPLINLMGTGLSSLTISNLQATTSTIASTVATVKSTVATAAHNTIQKAAAVGTKAWAVAQKAFNAVMAGNPIAIVVLAISTLISGMVAAYNSCDKFRQVMDGAFESVSKVTSAISSTWTKFKSLFGVEEEVAQSTEKVAEANKTLTETNEEAAASTDILTGTLDNQTKKLQTNLDTIGGVEQKISDLRTAQKSATGEQAIALEKEIRLWEKKQKAMENAILIGVATPPVLTPLVAPENKGIDLKKAGATNPKAGKDGKAVVTDSAPLVAATAGIDEAREKVLSFNESIWGSNSTIGQWANSASADVNRLSTIFQEFGTMLANDTLNTVQQASGGLQAMGAMMGTVGGMVDGAAGSWLSWGANVLGTIASALPQLLELFGVECAVAAAGAATSVASIPVVGWLMAGVAVASVIAALTSIPKPKPFANGGLVYGNTFAQVGEYPGAANNPEVIAPLSKLKNMLSPQGFSGGTVEFVIKGNRLVGVMNKENEKGRYF